MSSVNEYIEKCLAECPAGAEELLLAELIKKVQPKYGKYEQFEVYDEAGYCLGHFQPSYDMDFLEEVFPNAIEALRQEEARELGVSSLSREEFHARLLEKSKEYRRQLVEDALRA
jgi:hypothetical protein